MKKVETFYRLTKQEKDRLVEQCRKEIEARKVREIEEVRKILEELLETKWEKKKKTAQTEMQKMLDDLQRQVTEAQTRERQNSTVADGVTKKLTAAEARNSELSGELALAYGKLNNCQERLKTSEERAISLLEKLTGAEKLVGSLQGKLMASEENAGNLQNQLTAAADTNDTLRRLYSASGTTVENLRRAKSEDARRIKELEESLDAKAQEAETSAAEAQKYQKETVILEKKLEQENEKHATQKMSAWRGGWIFGILLAAVLCVVIFPTHHVSDSPIPSARYSGVTGRYSGGTNMFDQFSGFGEVNYDNATVCRGFWANGWLLYASEYVFQDNGVYSGNLGTNSRPLGAGTYTRTDGEKVFGLWSWAQEKTVKVGEDDVEYIYTGPMRFGKPYGYGIFDGSDEKERFVGEFYDDCFRNGTWIGADGATRKLNSH